MTACSAHAGDLSYCCNSVRCIALGKRGATVADSYVKEGGISTAIPRLYLVENQLRFSRALVVICSNLFGNRRSYLPFFPN